jgi:nitrate reductase gamma subunit
MDFSNVFLFVGLPYAAMIIFLTGTIQRYRNKGFKVSSLSSQFLEGRRLFWGSVPFHFGILVLFFGHLSAFLLPSATIMWNANPVRLIILEGTAFTFGLSTLVGLTALFVRRLTSARVRMVTTKMDIFLELLLLTQVVFGLWVAIGYRWGSSWFAADLAPYLWSLFRGDPNIIAVSAMPWPIKTHIVGAWLIIGIFPYTRLVHFLVAPLHYITRW